VEITTYRSDRYDGTSRKPEVEYGDSLTVDLGRRDFTVNAMAVRLTDGELSAWPGAREDLDAGILRVLHERSFSDDPTRILRLLRYSARLGFEPDPDTDALIDPALFATVSGDRLGRELRLLLDEPHPAKQLARHGIGKALLGERFRPVDIDASPLAKLAACCTEIEDLSQRLDALGFTAHDRKIVVAAARAPSVPASDAELWRAFRRLPPEAAEVAGAHRWLDEVRHRTLDITGDDLVAAGLSGAAVGEALERATVAMLDGKAPDRESQLAAALG
jgi:tRNA nucleotidyltransferase (CCA-adding enzyme)